MTRGVKTSTVPNHLWTEQEERVLVQVLEELFAKRSTTDGQLKWKRGIHRVIEREFKKIMPDTNIVAYPHIESKMKVFKRIFMVIYDMTQTSGFGWDDVRQCVTVESDEIWNRYVQSHPKAAKWRKTPFPLYRRLAMLYGKDSVDGSNGRTPASGAVEVGEGPFRNAGEGGKYNVRDSQEDEDTASPMSTNHGGSTSRKIAHGEGKSGGRRRRSRFAMEANEPYYVIHSELRQWMNYVKERDRAAQQGAKLDHDRQNMVIDQISTFDCFSQPEQNAAMEEILKSEQKMAMFLRFNMERRIDFVKQLLTSIGFHG